MKNMNEKQIRGIVPPLVTPLSGRDQLDIAGLERLIEHVLGAGAGGLFMLGTTGEGPSLSPRLSREVVRHSCRISGGRAPVLVAITNANRESALELARFAAEQGTAAVVAAPPPYFPLSQTEVLNYFDDLAGALPLPLLLYNMPAMTKVHIGLETTRALAQHPNIIGVKDSSGNMDHFLRLVRLSQTERPDWTMLIGSETLLPEAIAAGGDGGVCGGANFAPALFVELYHAARDDNRERARELQARVLELGETVYALDASPMAGVKGIKSALHGLGLIAASMLAPPLCGFGDAHSELLRDALAQFATQQVA